MPQLDQLSACPGCAEPLEAGDLYCGACGAPLAAALGTSGAGGAAPPPPVVPPPPAVPPAPAVPPPPQWAPSVAPGAEIPAAPAWPAPTPAQADFTLPAAAPSDVPEQPPAPAYAPGVQGAEPAAPDPRADPRTRYEAPSRVAGQRTVPAARRSPDPATVSRPVLSDFVDAGDTRPDHEVPSGPVPATEPADVPQPPSGGGDAGGPEVLGPVCVACGTGAVGDDGYCEHCGHKQPAERDHMEQGLRSAAAASDRGLRHHRNEDYFALVESSTAEGTLATIAVVCDGVSSASRPDEASAAAARVAAESMRGSVPTGAHPQQAVHDALVAAAEAVTVLASEAPNEPAKNAPACTIVTALTADGILTVGWIGDSRAYWVPDDRATAPARLTEDDSWAAQMVGAGLLTEAEAYADARAHAITGWLGADAYEVDPHTASFRPDRAGVVVVCSDGLWNYAESAEEMAAVVPLDARFRPLPCAQQLIGYALDGGGHDNITVAVIPFSMPLPEGS